MPWSRGRTFARHPGGPGSNPAYSSYFSDFEEQLEHGKWIAIAKVRKKGRNLGSVGERKKREDDVIRTRTEEELGDLIHIYNDCIVTLLIR